MKNFLIDMRERITCKFENNVWILDMLNFLKRELKVKERCASVGATFTDMRKQFFDNEVFSSLALLNQGLNSNHKPKSGIHLHEGRII